MASSAKQLTALTDLNTSFRYAKRDNIGADTNSRLGIVSMGGGHAFTQDWRISVDLKHRFTTRTTSESANDNRLAIFLRRDFLVRR